jgi:curved DNA-binding protein CbpA
MSSDILTDYYEDLQISPNADNETLERVYRLLAKRYHPDNGQTGSVEKFDLITQAYQILSKPEKRAAYDATYEEAKARQWKALSGATSSPGFKDDTRLRNSILSILYVERRNGSADSAIGLWRMEKMLGWPEKILEFHTWYLKEKGWIQRTDTGGYAITATGVDIVEEHNLILSEDRLLPDIKKRLADDDLVKETMEDKKSALQLISKKK